MSSGEPRGHKIPALPFPRGVLTEQEAISRHLRYLAAQVGPRPVGSAELARAHDYILDTAECIFCGSTGRLRVGLMPPEAKGTEHVEVRLETAP